MTGTFIDTIITCILTGSSIIVTGAWCGEAKGGVIRLQAFASVVPTFAPIIVTFCLVLFTFTIILGCCYYGERCMIHRKMVKQGNKKD